MITGSVPPAWLEFRTADPHVAATLLDVLTERAEQMKG